jgi:hypothetical protein
MQQAGILLQISCLTSPNQLEKPAHLRRAAKVRKLPTQQAILAENQSFTANVINLSFPMSLLRV